MTQERQTIVVLDGDETGQELLDEALRVLDPSVTRCDFIDFERFDLSLENRRATQNEVVKDAAKRIRETGLGIKAATITPETSGDVGSPKRNIASARWWEGYPADWTTDSISTSIGRCACPYCRRTDGGRRSI